MSHRQSTWPLVVAAATLGISAAALVYRFGPRTEPYSQFTVGAITWTAGAKLPDYLLLAALVLVAGIAWAVLASIAQHLAARLGSNQSDVFVSTITFCTLPAIAWAGGNLFGTMLALDLIYLACGAVVLCTGATLVVVRVLRVDPAATLPPIMTASLLGGLFAPVSALAINRVAMLAGYEPIWRGVPHSLWLIASGAALATMIALAVVPSSNAARVRHLLGFLQLPYPWAFLSVLPSPWRDGDTVASTFPLHWLPAGVLVLVASGYVDLLRRWFAETGESDRRWTSVISPICFAAVILVFRLGVPPAAHLSSDDYHFGEWVLPWWSWSSEGQLPFRDHVPARGMVNYSSGIAADLLGDGSASFIAASAPFVMAIWFTGAVTATAALVGTLPAAAMFAMPPVSDRITDIDLVLTTLLMMGWVAFYKTSATRWVIAWLAAAIPAFLFAPGQALLIGMATAPVFMWQVGRGLLDERKALRRAILWTVGSMVILVLATPVGAMLLGAWRYVVEHSAVASVAHGVEWRASIGTQGAGNHWIAEAIRTSFIAVPVAAVIALGALLLQRRWVQAGRLAVIAVPVLLLGLLYIPRAASRIDPGSASRLGLTSAWMHSALMPVLLWAAWGEKRWPTILAIAIFVLGALSPMLGGIIYPGAFEVRAVPYAPQPAFVTDGAGVGLPALGYADVNAEDLSRLVRIRRTLDALLDPEETYLDLTNRNAHYFYFNRRVPIESGAIYNLPNETQQARAIRRLEAERVPLVLADSEKYLHDGGPLSLRGHGIYRYLVQRYEPIRISRDVYLVRPDRMARATAQPGFDAAADPLLLLDAAFAPPPLQGIAVAWGNAWNELQENAVLIGRVKISAQGELRFDAPIAGRDAGLLVLETSCGAAITKAPALSVSWSGDIAGGTLEFRAGPRLVVPLDASPRWLLSRRITALQLAGGEATGCGAQSITRAELWQRRIAAIADVR